MKAPLKDVLVSASDSKLVKTLNICATVALLNILANGLTGWFIALICIELVSCPLYRLYLPE